MPKWVRDEDKWKKAKEIVKKEYDKDEKNPEFWKIVTGVYKNLGGEIESKKNESGERVRISALTGKIEGTRK